MQKTTSNSVRLLHIILILYSVVVTMFFIWNLAYSSDYKEKSLHLAKNLETMDRILEGSDKEIERLVVKLSYRDDKIEKQSELVTELRKQICEYQIRRELDKKKHDGLLAKHDGLLAWIATDIHKQNEWQATYLQWLEATKRSKRAPTCYPLPKKVEAPK